MNVAWSANWREPPCRSHEGARPLLRAKELSTGRLGASRPTAWRRRQYPALKAHEVSVSSDLGITARLQQVVNARTCIGVADGTPGGVDALLSSRSSVCHPTLRDVPPFPQWPQHHNRVMHSFRYLVTSRRSGRHN